jgi:hypothetical protein
VPLTADVMQHSDGFGVSPTSARVNGYTLPNAWPMDSVSQVFNADGTPYTADQAKQCFAGDPEKDFACMAGQNLHFSYTYQPGSRYWPFQWIEFSVYTFMAALLAAFGLWWVRRRASLS